MLNIAIVQNKQEKTELLTIYWFRFCLDSVFVYLSHLFASPLCLVIFFIPPHVFWKGWEVTFVFLIKYYQKKTIIYSPYTSFLILQTSKFSNQIILLHPYYLFLNKCKVCTANDGDNKRNNNDNLRKVLYRRIIIEFHY